MATAPLIAVPTLAVLLFLLVVPAAPAVPAGLALATLLALWLGAPGIVLQDLPAASLPLTSWPSPDALQRSLSLLVLPQLSLTFANAVLLTARVAGDYFGARAAHGTPRRLSINSGLANLRAEEHTSELQSLMRT